MYNILCVDDIPANLLILESLFELHEEHYNILTATSGQEALDVLLNKKVDLMLLDVMMPDMDGFETAQFVKLNKKTQDIPIIFLTAKKDDETVHNAFKYGVDYLSKPYDEFELFTRISVQIELITIKRQFEEQLKFNQSIIDAQHNIVFIQDDQHVISANKSFKEFFKVANIDAFNKEHSCVSELFMEYENYFALNILNDSGHWAEEISSTKQDKEYNVLIMDITTFEPKAFKIDVSGIKDTDKFVVTLTDITKLTTKSKEFETKATYDVLTKIFNRSKFNDVFEVDVKKALNEKSDLCFAIMDIDFFKKVNDNYGHIIGDETLITFAQTIDKKVKKIDTFARWGGEEFVISLPGSSIDEAFKIVDDFRQLIENTEFKEVGTITCSIGLTQMIKDDTIDNILIRSDKALYEAKDTGRNKVCIK